MPYLSPQACSSFSLRRQTAYISALGWAWKIGMNSAPKPRPTMATRILSEAMRCSFLGGWLVLRKRTQDMRGVRAWQGGMERGRTRIGRMGADRAGARNEQM